MPKILKLWNGGGYCCRKHGDPLWKDVPRNSAPHAYIAAYSRADARRVIQEYCGRLPSDTELKEYFAEVWGVYMNGVTPERGLWLAFDRTKPTRVL